MLGTHLYTELGQLNRADKLRIMQFLVIELAKEEGALLDPNAKYPVWLPYNSCEAANTLMNLLNNDMPETKDA